MNEEFDNSAPPHLLTKILLGRAVAFFGAGFSIGAEHSDGKVPSTSTLIEQFKSLLSFSEHEFIEFYELSQLLEDKIGADKVRSFLYHQLTAVKLQAFHSVLTCLPWRSCFTTNFDNILEIGGESRDQRFYPISRYTDLETARLNLTPLVYLNGRAADINDSQEPPHLVLSTNSYIERSNRDSPLFKKLSRELSVCEAIVFIGYSANDAAVRDILSSRPELRQKTHFFIHPDSSQRDIQRLARLGKIVLQTAEDLAASISAFQVDEIDLITPSLVEEIKWSPEPYENFEISDVFINSLFDYSAFAYQISDANAEKLFPVRTATRKVIDRHSDNLRRFIIYGNAVSGKTFVAEQISILFASEGCQAFYIDNLDPYIMSEIHEIQKRIEKAVFIFDDASRHLNELETVSESLRTTHRLVAVFDTHFMRQRHSDVSKTLSGIKNFEMHDVSDLDDYEVEQFDFLLERTGFWGEMPDWRGPTRDFIIKRCGRELRSLVSYLFKQGSAGRRINQLFQEMVLQNDLDKRPIAGLLIAGMARSGGTFSAQDILGWLDFDIGQIHAAIMNIRANDIFTSDGFKLVIPKSRALCTFLLQSDPF
ncbi:SIR2 family protein [Hyphomonadaceae bacterium BL14]|nr:SIR2 family protein [Hyphomonadaceae bacterium BL14]